MAAATMLQPTAGPSTHPDGAGSASSAAVFKRLHPAEYLSRFLEKGYRPDGREVRAWRDVSVNVGSISTADGSALVRMGDTTMVCGIKAEIAEPDLSHPNDGYVVPNIDLPALCSPSFKPGPPSELAQTLSNWLNDLLVSSRTILPSTLCISPSKSCYALYIDVVCINYDGNAFDCAVLAVMAALRSTTLPQATFDPDTGRTLCSPSERHPLQLGRIPLACSFGAFQSRHLLPDPSAFEAPLLPTTMTIALDERDRACLLRHEGLGGLEGLGGEKVLAEAWSLAELRVRALREILDRSRNVQ